MLFNQLLPKEWQDLVIDKCDSDILSKLNAFVEEAYSNQIVFPPKTQLFRAFDLLKPQDVRVVIIGQDPYHNYNQANGLAFSVHDSTPIPPSLRNIFKEILDDIGSLNLFNGNLEAWAEQGVLLLNRVLSVEAHKPNSHQKMGWEHFTEMVVRLLSELNTHLVFMLWGKTAHSMKTYIFDNQHLVIETAHPSPLSAYTGFLGSKQFSIVNAFLLKHHKYQIQW